MSIELDRACVDAVRAILGFGPLYAAERSTDYAEEVTAPAAWYITAQWGDDVTFDNPDVAPRAISQLRERAERMRQERTEP